MFTINLALVLVSFLPSISKAAWQANRYWHETRELTLNNHKPLKSYDYAKAKLMQDIHLEKDAEGFFVEDVYCDIKFRRSVGPGRIPSPSDVNVEHTWPQSKFNKRFDKNIQKSDLHHLYPTDSKANSKRGNHPFTDFPQNSDATNVFPHCPASKFGHTDRGVDAFEPPDHHKGNVARALFYFSLRYDIRINDYEEFVLRQWNMMDPVDAEELKRNDMVEKYQGNRNPFIDDPQLADLIPNF
jgi:deoxyribonuclease I